MSLPPPRAEPESKLAMSPDADTSSSVTGPHTGTEQHKHREGHGYQHKKIGDLLDEVNDLLSRKRDLVTAKAAEKVHGMLDDLKALYQDLKGMANESPENIDPIALKRKQNHLNDIENKAVQGVYGAEAKICPLDKAGQPIHHVRVQAIPPGQATVRDLIEKCHQMVTRVMDRLEESVTSMGLGGSEQGISTATTTTTVHTGVQGTGQVEGQQPQIQTHATGVTLTQGQHHQPPPQQQ